MIQILCDRCGKEINKDGNDNELYFTKNRNTRSGYDEKINLCDNCLKEFDKFIGGDKS